MPNVADYIAIQDHGVTIPDPDTGINDVHFEPFAAPSVAGPPSILLFRVSTQGTVTMQVALNDTLLVTQTCDARSQLSWHEIISTDLVAAEGNALTVAVSGAGSLFVSDVVLLYQRSV